MEQDEQKQEQQTSNTTIQPINALPTLQQLRDSEERYYAKKRGESAPIPLTETAKAYTSKLKEHEKREHDYSINALLGEVSKRSLRNFIAYPYQFDEIYPVALKIYQKRLELVGVTLVWESDSEEIFKKIVRYFIGDSSGVYDLSKGIYLFGGFGLGKTLLMHTFQEFTKLVEDRLKKADVYFTKRSFKFNPCKDIAMEIQRTAKTDSLNQYMTEIRCFDDLGNEDEKKIYGNDVNSMAEILLARYNRYQSGGEITHVTSNVAPHECSEVYGDRVGSRMFEMFNHVYLDGSDKRKKH